MNWCNMFLHAIHVRKSFTTNFTSNYCFSPCCVRFFCWSLFFFLLFPCVHYSSAYITDIVLLSNCKEHFVQYRSIKAILMNYVFFKTFLLTLFTMTKQSIHGIPVFMHRNMWTTSFTTHLMLQRLRDFQSILVATENFSKQKQTEFFFKKRKVFKRQKVKKLKIKSCFVKSWLKKSMRNLS